MTALGLTTVMVTHDVLEAVLLADRIAVIEEGELVPVRRHQKCWPPGAGFGASADGDAAPPGGAGSGADGGRRALMWTALDPRVHEALQRLPEYLGPTSY
jgi:energy-coupling factor transporter ATP-binding protein EcfA2